MILVADRAPRREETAQRKEQILAAALRCFVELGYAQTTMDDIRRRSGASNGSVYHHFHGKEELGTAIYLEAWASAQERVNAALRRCRVAERGVRAFVYAHLDWIAERPEQALYLLHMRHTELGPQGEERVRDLKRSGLREVFAWMEPFVARGEIAKLPPHLYPAFLGAPTQEFARHWLIKRRRAELLRTRPILARVTWKAFAP